MIVAEQVILKQHYFVIVAERVELLTVGSRAVLGYLGLIEQVGFGQQDF